MTQKVKVKYMLGGWSVVAKPVDKPKAPYRRLDGTIYRDREVAIQHLIELINDRQDLIEA